MGQPRWWFPAETGAGRVAGDGYSSGSSAKLRYLEDGGAAKVVEGRRPGRWRNDKDRRATQLCRFRRLLERIDARLVDRAGRRLDADGRPHAPARSHARAY